MPCTDGVYRLVAHHEVAGSLVLHTAVAAVDSDRRAPPQRCGGPHPRPPKRAHALSPTVAKRPFRSTTLALTCLDRAMESLPARLSVNSVVLCSPLRLVLSVERRSLRLARIGVPERGDGGRVPLGCSCPGPERTRVKRVGVRPSQSSSPSLHLPGKRAQFGRGLASWTSSRDACSSAGRPSVCPVPVRSVMPLCTAFTIRRALVRSALATFLYTQRRNRVADEVLSK
jgi:hypothetical protein